MIQLTVKINLERPLQVRSQQAHELQFKSKADCEGSDVVNEVNQGEVFVFWA